MTEVDSVLCVRIAALPFSFLAPLPAAGEPAGALLAAWTRDTRVRTMLRLAGREVLRASARVEEDPARWRARHRRAAATVLRTVVRAATKTTPLGVSCTTALGAFGAAFELDGSPAPARVRARILRGDALRLVEVVERADRAVRSGVPVRLNPTLVRAGEALEFWRPATRRDPSALERRVRVRATALLETVIERVSTGPTYAALAAWLAEQSPDAVAWLDRLWETGLLGPASVVPHLEERPLRTVAARATPGRTRTVLERVEAAIDAVEGATGDVARLAAIERADDTWSAEREVIVDAPASDPATCAVQVDAAAALHAVLPAGVRSELARVIERYARWFAALYPAPLLLAPFVARFLRVHPPDRAVPLAACYHGVFDGIGQPTRESFPAPGAGDSAAARHARAAHARFAAFRARRLAGAGDALDLVDADWEELAGDTPAPRFACGILFQFDPASGRLAWNGLYGPGLASSRLASLHAGTTGALPLAEQAKESWRWVAGEEGVIAEIPFSHAGRTANAGLRTPSFGHEIELPGETPTPGTRALPLSALTVRFDSARGRFEIVAPDLDRPVVPVLTSSLNPEGFVAFLVAVGLQGAQPLAWFPEFDSTRPGPLPEITSGSTVLHRRRHRLPPAEANAAFGGPDPAASIAAWRRAACASRHQFAAADDSPKPRYVDLAAAAFHPELRALARSGSPVTLREMWPLPADVTGPRGHAVEYLAQVRGAGAT